MPRRPQRIPTGNVDVDRAFDQLRGCVDDLATSAVLNPYREFDVELADATARRVRHGLGRRAFVTVSPPRGATAAGRLVLSDDADDPANYVVLTATGYGATVTVDVKCE